MCRGCISELISSVSEIILGEQEKNMMSLINEKMFRKIKISQLIKSICLDLNVLSCYIVWKYVKLMGKLFIWEEVFNKPVCSLLVLLFLDPKTAIVI